MRTARKLTDAVLYGARTLLEFPSVGDAGMNARLDDATADRLAKILGLLGSDHAGGRASAAAKADALVRGAGLTWRDVVMPSPPIAPQLEGGSDWRRLAAECHRQKARLNPGETKFIAAILAWRTEPSPKQLAWLTAIHDRLHGASGRSA